MELIKKNIVLFVILGIAGLLSAFLLYKVVEKKHKLDENWNTIEGLKKKIEEFNRNTPAPIQKNLDLIQEDTKVLKRKLSEVNKIFGKPYRKALSKCASVLLGEKDEDKAYVTLRDKWRKFWKQEAKKDVSPQALLVKFLSELKVEKDGKEVEIPKEQKDQALATFKEVLQAESDERVTESTVSDILMEAMGLPRKITPGACKQFMFDLREKLILRLKDANILASEDVMKFTFGDWLGPRMPPADQVPMIIRNWKLIEDLVRRRIIPAKVGDLSVDILTRRNLEGERDPDLKDFLFLRYEIELTGDLNSIRKFIDNLQQSFKDNRIYIVSDVKVEKIKDDVKTLQKDIGAARNLLEDTPKFDVAAVKKAATREEFEEKSKEYGKPIIGTDRSVKATIEFKYVIYVADDLTF